ncbi:MAG TPA: trigger factor [Vicinamibacterales bacterium]|nr:trigger factor [Vicinamibacterales bacterium]
MKTAFADLSETKKSVAVEIPSDIVDAQIDRVARSYSRQARVPGFRQGKVPPTLIKKRFRDQILHDVAHDLIPRAIDEALRERGLEPVDTPDVKDVTLDEGQALTFTATFETLPPIDPGPLNTISLRRPAVTLEEDAVEKTLAQLQARAARYAPVEGRGVEGGDTVTLDMERQPTAAGERADHHHDVAIEIGGKANPPGLDDELKGLTAGAEKSFTIHYPDDYAVKEMAGTSVSYTVKVKDIRTRILPALDDEFAKDIGEFETLQALRERIQQDLQREADAEADRNLKSDLLKELAARVTVDVPDALVERELDRRTEEFARRLMDQQIDPRRANIDWDQFRDSQREASRESVKSALVLDEISRREHVTVTDDDIERDVAEYAGRSGRTPAAVRATLEKEGALSRLSAGLRREKTMDLVLSQAQVTKD